MMLPETNEAKEPENRSCPTDKKKVVFQLPIINVQVLLLLVTVQGATNLPSIHGHGWLWVPWLKILESGCKRTYHRLHKAQQFWVLWDCISCRSDFVLMVFDTDL